jgi:hypothetical protein
MSDPALSRRNLLIAGLALPAVGLPAAVRAGSASDRVLKPGTGDYLFSGWAGPPIQVFYAAPDNLGPDTPVVVVIHGAQRDADVYRDQWADLARAGGFVVLAPRFDKGAFPKESDFSQGGVFGDKDEVRPRKVWTFSAIEPMFDDYVHCNKSSRKSYRMYGHSGGSQFVHRFLFLTPGARADRVVMANAGWYTLPDPTIAWPYGLKGLPAGAANPGAAFAREATVLLGDADIDPNHKSLRHTPEADAQGAFRFARGHSFFRSARDQAERLGKPFNWKLAYVPGADHQNKLMAPQAAAILSGEAASHAGDPERPFD